jgi:hypothetical protein
VAFVVVAERSRKEATEAVPEAVPERRRITVRRFLRRGAVVGATAVVLLGMMFAWNATGAPRIPHQVTEGARSHCATCHFDGVNDTTDEANVPDIDAVDHPSGAGAPPGNCVECHEEGGSIEVEGAMVVQTAGDPHPPVQPLALTDADEIEALRAYERDRQAR